MKHTDKIEIGRRLLTKTERLTNTPVFSSVGWFNRKRAIAERVERQQNLAHTRWARNYDKCQKCQTTSFPHHGQGLCSKCRPQAIQKAERISRKEFNTIHLSCEICSKKHDTGIPVEQTENSLDTLQVMQSKFRESHINNQSCHIEIGTI